MLKKALVVFLVVLVIGCQRSFFDPGDWERQETLSQDAKEVLDLFGVADNHEVTWKSSPDNHYLILTTEGVVSRTHRAELFLTFEKLGVVYVEECPFTSLAPEEGSYQRLNTFVDFMDAEIPVYNWGKLSTPEERDRKAEFLERTGALALVVTATSEDVSSIVTDLQVKGVAVESRDCTGTHVED